VAALNFENVVFPDSVGFQCKSCGFCCKNNPPDTNLKEQGKIEAKGYKNFLETDAAQAMTICRKKDGACIFLTEDNNCKIHDVKPSICRLEPFFIADYDDKTNRIFLELNPLAAETCTGIFKGELVAPREIALAAQEIVKEISEIAAEKLGLGVGDKKVAQLTREIIRDINAEE
jgi:Fe-S-cluster containining protein